jgi:CelD/BcsL family acetyltransferase involved in cellulose biosynthesis
LDRLTIEHNGFLTAHDAPENLAAQVFATLLERRDRYQWDEIVLSGVSQALGDAAAAANLTVETDQRSTFYRVPLARIRNGNTGWLETISRNSRAKIQQAGRTAETAGPLAVDAARSQEDADRYFDAMAALHQERWKHTAGGGAFTSPMIRAFHKLLIARGLAAGTVELLRISAGADVLGYLYNFIAGKTVFNYQSGFRRLPDNRDRPGLVAHRLCIERALQNGFDSYDLLAGDMQYKRSIAAPAGEMVWVRAQAPHGALALERAARSAKRRLGAQFGKV